MSFRCPSLFIKLFLFECVFLISTPCLFFSFFPLAASPLFELSSQFSLPVQDAISSKGMVLFIDFLCKNALSSSRHYILYLCSDARGEGDKPVYCSKTKSSRVFTSEKTNKRNRVRQSAILYQLPKSFSPRLRYYDLYYKLNPLKSRIGRCCITLLLHPSSTAVYLHI